jgi:hypothetical protein
MDINIFYLHKIKKGNKKPHSYQLLGIPMWF